MVELANDYPEKRSLEIRFPDLDRFSLDIAQELLDHPDGVLKHANEALFAIDLPAEIEFKKTHVRIAGCPTKIRRRDIRQEHVNQLVCLDGIVQRATEVTPRIINAIFKCQRCGHEHLMPQAEGKFVEPYECEDEACGRKGPFKHLIDQSEKVDFQKVRLQERPEDLKGGEKSQTIDIDIDDDLAGILLPGNKVTVTGILRAYQRIKATGKTPYLDLCIDAVHIQVNEVQESIVLTAEDKNRMLAYSSQDKIVDHLVDSFAPTVYGMREVKEGMLCCMVSNGLTYRGDGTPQKEYLNLALITDPGMAKSNLKFACKNIFPGLVLSSGTGSTTAGLTAAAIKDDFAGGSWSIEAGALPLADMSGLVIDEFDKKSDKRMLNDALSNCQIEIDKAGFRLKLWTRCFVIALLNPKYGRFDQYLQKADQLDIAPDTLSRFDLIFALEDEVNETQDRNIAEQMTKAWGGDETSMQGAIIIGDLQKYIALARTISPKLSTDVSKAIVNQFVFTRQKGKDGKVAITKRYVESLLRIAKAEAQLALSNTITMEHYSRAVNLLEASILQVGTDDKGDLDADIIAAGRGKSQLDKVKLIIEIIKGLSQDNGKMAPVGGVVLEVLEKGIKDEELRALLESMKNQGDIYEPKPGFLKVA